MLQLANLLMLKNLQLQHRSRRHLRQNRKQPSLLQVSQQSLDQIRHESEEVWYDPGLYHIEPMVE